MIFGESLKARALEIGFDLVGIAPATPGRDLDFVCEWLGRGYDGEMAYLSNPKRFDPKLVLPSVQSVICVGLVYDTPLPYSTEVGSRQWAVGNEQNSESRIQNPESECEGSGFMSQDSGGPRAKSPQPPSSGIGWSAAGGAGEETESQFSDFGSPVSSFNVPVSSPAGRQDAGAPRGWISRYAWGRDYHEIMREKLERLRAAIEALAPGAETRVFVDSGPVSERAFARWSGLGWMGKNTCIINEAKGSWFFLGVVLTNLALEPGLPAPDRCGSCTACLDACPTGALVEPYVMDARRCISYLTIELKGSIPQDLRKGIGSNIFGCDICQDVCPWNRRSQESEVRSQENDFLPMAINWPVSHEGQMTNDEGLVGCLPADTRESSIQNPPGTRHLTPDTFFLFAPPLAALAAMTEDDFRLNFRHSPIRRTKYRGWLRNLCVAMGNSGDARFIPRLTDLAAHPDPIVREHALWALDRLSGLASTLR